MKKRVVVFLMTAVMALGLAACGNSGQKEETAGEKQDSKEQGSTQGGADIEGMTFDELKESAKGSTVTFYGWGGDELLNQWLDDVFAPAMKEEYDITMERVPMDIDQVLSQLSGEIQAGEEDGSKIGRASCRERV